MQELTRRPSYWETLKASWRCVKHGRAGSRFVDCHRYKETLRRQHGNLTRNVDLVVGALLVLAGLVMMPAPGPGWPLLALGLALLGGEFVGVARWLDKTELLARWVINRFKQAWRDSTILVKVGLIFFVGSVAVAVCYFGWLLIRTLFLS